MTRRRERERAPRNHTDGPPHTRVRIPKQTRPSAERKSTQTRKRSERRRGTYIYRYTCTAFIYTRERALATQVRGSSAEKPEGAATLRNLESCAQVRGIRPHSCHASFSTWYCCFLAAQFAPLPSPTPPVGVGRHANSQSALPLPSLPVFSSVAAPTPTGAHTPHLHLRLGAASRLPRRSHTLHRVHHTLAAVAEVAIFVCHPIPRVTAAQVLQHCRHNLFPLSPRAEGYREDVVPRQRYLGVLQRQPLMVHLTTRPCCREKAIWLPSFLE